MKYDWSFRNLHYLKKRRMAGQKKVTSSCTSALWVLWDEENQTNTKKETQMVKNDSEELNLLINHVQCLEICLIVLVKIQVG